MLNTASHTLRALKNHPLRATVGGLGLYGVLDVVGRGQTVSGLIAAYYGPAWTAAGILSSVTFKVICLVAVAWALWSIGRSSKAEERETAAKSQAIADREAAAIATWQEREAALHKEWQDKLAALLEQAISREETALRGLAEVPVAMSKAGLFANELAAFDKFIATQSQIASEYEEQCRKWLGDEPISVEHQRPPEVPNHGLHIMPFYSFKVPALAVPAFKPTQIAIQTSGDFPRKMHTYDPAKNAVARDAMQINIDALKGRVDKLREVRDAEQANLARMHQELEERIKRYGA